VNIDSAALVCAKVPNVEILEYRAYRCKIVLCLSLSAFRHSNSDSMGTSQKHIFLLHRCLTGPTQLVQLACCL
jgi:hypothetical protein